MSDYRGDFLPGATVRIPWNTNQASGASVTRGTNGTIAVYKDGGTTESTAGVTDVEDHDGDVGTHIAVIDTSADSAFYTPGSDYTVKMKGPGVIDGQNVSSWIGGFSLANRYYPGLVLRGKLLSGDNDTVGLPSNALADDVLIGATVALVAGAGQGQSRTAWDSVGGATDTMEVSPVFAVAPDTTSYAEVYATPPGVTKAGSEPLVKLAPVVHTGATIPLVSAVTGMVGQSGDAYGLLTTTHTPANLAAAVWSATMASGKTAIQVMRGLSAYLFGKITGTRAHPIIRDAADTKDVMQADEDSTTGNRSNVTTDLS
jgi:hypothetical protein